MVIYITHSLRVKTTDGRKHGYDYLVTDILDDVLRYRHDACYLRYLEAWTSPNNCKYSNILDTYILERDCVYNDELRDYIFNDDNKSQNDNERIDSQLEYIREKRREREERDSRRRSERSERVERDRLRSENITERTAQPIDVIDALSDIFGSDHLSLGRIGMFDAYRIVMRSIDRLPTDSRIRIEFSHVVLDDFNSLPRESRTREELERIISETTLLYMNV